MYGSDKQEARSAGDPPPTARKQSSGQRRIAANAAPRRMRRKYLPPTGANGRTVDPSLGTRGQPCRALLTGGGAPDRDAQCPPEQGESLGGRKEKNLQLLGKTLFYKCQIKAVATRCNPGSTHHAKLRVARGLLGSPVHVLPAPRRTVRRRSNPDGWRVLPGTLHRSRSTLKSTPLRTPQKNNGTPFSEFTCSRRVFWGLVDSVCPAVSVLRWLAGCESLPPKWRQTIAKDVPVYTALARAQSASLPR